MSSFALRHFKRGVGTAVTDVTPKDFVKEVNSIAHSWYEGESVIYDLQDSLYPFCKYLTLKNFTDAKPSSLPITLENYPYIRSGYSARREGELPYLSRWFDFPVKDQSRGEYLILILYSREQLLKEYKENKGNKAEFEIGEDCDYGIVGIQALNESFVEPMTPYTMIRNSLGIKWGGNGEDINESYLKDAAEYWNTHAIIKQ